MNLKEIDLKSIKQESNSRTTYRESDLHELMGSIKKSGILQPIGVYKKNNNYIISYGNRRFIAAKKLGLKTIPVVILESNDERQSAVNNLAENYHRQNVGVTEIGIYLIKLQKELKMTPQELAERTNIPLSRIKLALEIVNRIPENLQADIKDFTHTRGHAVKKGAIPSSYVNTILNSGLDKNEEKRLLTKSKEDAFTHNHLLKAINILKGGGGIDTAITKQDKFKAIRMNMYLSIEDIKRFKSNSKFINAARAVLKRELKLKSI